MAKTSTKKNAAPTVTDLTNPSIQKTKRTRRTVHRASSQNRSSIYRGVTKHRLTGRYEAHLWLKDSGNESNNKKGKQVYLGAYDDEIAAAHAYDLATLKILGQDSDPILNFPIETYQKDLKEMENVSKEEYLGSLRRKSSGFSRGVSKYRGVARHHHNGRWEARIGRIYGNKYLYLGTFATQEEAAVAYDMAAIEYRGLNAITNFDLNRYIQWLRPNNSDGLDLNQTPNNQNQQPESSSSGETTTSIAPPPPASAGGTDSSALGLLLSSPKFKEMIEKAASGVDSSLTVVESDPPRGSFPDHIQTYFDCNESNSYAEGEGNIFADLNSLADNIFHGELNA